MTTTPSIPSNPGKSMPNPPDSAPGGPAGASARWSANRKIEIVFRLIRGESLDAVSRETGVPPGRLSEWRDEFVEAGKAALKSRAPEASSMTDAERRAMAAKIGEITMENALLHSKI
jgi:hypothetical protein